MSGKATRRDRQRADGGGADLSAEEAARLFAANFAEAQYCFVELFCDHLSACSRAFDGDLQKPLILALVGQAYLNGLQQRGPGGKARTITASRIADVTGVPRQTVNRKLWSLAGEGYIARRPGGWVLDVRSGKSVAGQRLAGLTTNQIDAVSRFLAGFDRIRRRHRPFRSSR